jgi:hypothetical protein
LREEQEQHEGCRDGNPQREPGPVQTCLRSHSIQTTMFGWAQNFVRAESAYSQ